MRVAHLLANVSRLAVSRLAVSREPSGWARGWPGRGAARSGCHNTAAAALAANTTRPTLLDLCLHAAGVLVQARPTDERALRLVERALDVTLPLHLAAAPTVHEQDAPASQRAVALDERRGVAGDCAGARRSCAACGRDQSAARIQSFIDRARCACSAHCPPRGESRIARR